MANLQPFNCFPKKDSGLSLSFGMVKFDNEQIRMVNNQLSSL